MITKIGAARRVPHSRIWVEGARLIAAGFTHGARYDVTVVTGLTLTLSESGARRVAGTPSRPIIDITGALVRDNFSSEFATVEFSPSIITVKDYK